MKIFRFLIILLLLVGCTHFEIVNVIEPEITIIGKEVGVIYKLGKLTVSDTWRKVDSDKIEYLKNPENNLKITLHVNFNEETHNDPYFYYYINGILFAETTGVISEEVLLANMNDIDNFFLHKLDGKEPSKNNEKIIEKKIAEIKEETKVAIIVEKKIAEIDNGNKYEEDSKW